MYIWSVCLPCCEVTCGRDFWLAATYLPPFSFSLSLSSLTYLPPLSVSFCLAAEAGEKEAEILKLKEKVLPLPSLPSFPLSPKLKHKCAYTYMCEIALLSHYSMYMPVRESVYAIHCANNRIPWAHAGLS